VVAAASDNIDATHSVFEAARRRGIEKVVFASTNHVVGFYNLEAAWPIDTHAPIRPDSLYGVSKASGEALARYYSNAFGMSIICLRIGWYTPRAPSVRELNPLWISARDELGYAPEDDVVTIATETDNARYVDPRAGVLAPEGAAPGHV
jgi:nucleoside-diphosphate-sugar epimerase